MLALLVALVVLMPVSYRAGTDTSHAHTIFQGLIDRVIGQPHHHHDDHVHEADTAAAPSIGDGEDAVGRPAAERMEPSPTSPDMPSWLGLSSPIDATAAIHALGALVAGLLAGLTRRSLDTPVRFPVGLMPAVEPPPPRPA